MKQLCILLVFDVIFIACGSPGFGGLPLSSEKELKDNFAKKYKEISVLKSYFNSITHQNLDVYIEFEQEKSIDLKVYYKSAQKYQRRALFEQWDINPYNFKHEASPLDSGELAPETTSLEAVKNRLGWTDETFRTLKKYLDKANCISVTNGEPTNVGFRRTGMGMYFYDLFDKPLGDSLKNIYNDSCQYRLYNDTVVLEYGGGAIGGQCFPDN